MKKKLLNPDLDGLEVKESELLVATSDGGDGTIDTAVLDLLRLLRTRLAMDVVFVSEFVDGKRAFRFVDSGAPLPGVEVGGTAPLEESWCQRVVDGRLPEYIPVAAECLPGSAPGAPFPIGTHLSVPIRLHSGEVYGTLCCFSHSPSPQTNRSDLVRLRTAANILAIKLDQAEAQVLKDPWRYSGTQRR